MMTEQTISRVLTKATSSLHHKLTTTLDGDDNDVVQSNLSEDCCFQSRRCDERTVLFFDDDVLASKEKLREQNMIIYRFLVLLSWSLKEILEFF